MRRVKHLVAILRLSHNIARFFSLSCQNAMGPTTLDGHECLLYLLGRWFLR
jgi:hypothetical protein